MSRGRHKHYRPRHAKRIAVIAALTAGLIALLVLILALLPGAPVISPVSQPTPSPSPTAAPTHSQPPVKVTPRRHPARPHASPPRVIVTVSEGDNLWDIAGQYMRNPVRWHQLYAANRAVIGSNPNLIQPGMRLVILS